MYPLSLSTQFYCLTLSTSKEGFIEFKGSFQKDSDFLKHYPSVRERYHRVLCGSEGARWSTGCLFFHLLTCTLESLSQSEK